ncbi:MAG TPA: putative toxin-antitoxin system toxin component, PIN family [Thermodesulfobacteriota bacterium]|nr:putative toxin-antitoxin system toxin component, PIN family [Thermodesulfobacteriota bacterium]
MVPIPKVVIDTNVLISGFGWKGKPKKILKLIEEGKVKNFTSPDIVEEVRRVVSYKKLGFTDDLQAEIIEFIYFYSEIVTPKKRLDIVKEDPDDNKFLECAVEAKAEYIISGNRHLLKLKAFKGIDILTANDFLSR